MKCNIQVDHCEPIFYAGEQISGIISLIPTKSCIIQAIDLIFVGQTVVQWSSINNNPLYITHDDSSTTELYEWITNKFLGIQQHINYIRRLSNTIKVEHQNQEYKFYYKIPLPNNIPCSAVQQYGNTTYKLKIQIIYNKYSLTQTFEREICIRNYLNLQLLQELHQPIAIHEDLQHYKFLFKIPKTGYTPGQRIPYNINFIGIGKQHIQIIVVLNCFIRYKALHPCPEMKYQKKCLVLNEHKSNENIKSYIQIPLTTETSTNYNHYRQNQQQLHEEQHYLISLTYNMEILLINSITDDIFKSYEIDLIIGTKPSYRFDELWIEEEGRVDAGIINYGYSMCEDS